MDMSEHHWYLDDGTFVTKDWFTGEEIRWKIEKSENGSVTVKRYEKSSLTDVKNNEDF